MMSVPTLLILARYTHFYLSVPHRAATQKGLCVHNQLDPHLIHWWPQNGRSKKVSHTHLSITAAFSPKTPEAILWMLVFFCRKWVECSGMLQVLSRVLPSNKTNAIKNPMYKTIMLGTVTSNLSNVISNDMNTRRHLNNANSECSQFGSIMIWVAWTDVWS